MSIKHSSPINATTNFTGINLGIAYNVKHNLKLNLQVNFHQGTYSTGRRIIQRIDLSDFNDIESFVLTFTENLESFGQAIIMSQDVTFNKALTLEDLNAKSEIDYRISLQQSVRNFTFLIGPSYSIITTRNHQLGIASNIGIHYYINDLPRFKNYLLNPEFISKGRIIPLEELNNLVWGPEENISNITSGVFQINVEYAYRLSSLISFTTKPYIFWLTHSRFSFGRGVMFGLDFKL